MQVRHREGGQIDRLYRASNRSPERGAKRGQPLTTGGGRKLMEVGEPSHGFKKFRKPREKKKRTLTHDTPRPIKRQR